jgi:hypothetical protein
MIGRVHRGRYYSTDIGYDPGSARWSVGNLHAEVVRDLIATKAATLFAAASATRSGRFNRHQPRRRDFSKHSA